jgi:hypothetical protein
LHDFWIRPRLRGRCAGHHKKADLIVVAGALLMRAGMIFLLRACAD